MAQPPFGDPMVSPEILHGYACAVLQGFVDDLASIVRHLRSLSRAFERETEPQNEKSRFLLVCSSREAYRCVEGVTSAAYARRLPRLRHAVSATPAPAELNAALQQADTLMNRLHETRSCVHRCWHGLGRLHDDLGPSLTALDHTRVASFYIEYQEAVSIQATELDRATESLREYVYRCAGGGFGLEGFTT